MARTAAGGILAALGTSPAYAGKFVRTSPSSEQLIHVGVITCGHYSHIEDIWGRLINPIGRDTDGSWWPRQTGMVMTTVWDPDQKAAETFAKKYDVKIAKRFDDMVGKVDAVIFSDYYATGWWPQ